ncbi:hypothetical protein ACQR0Z_04890 [Bradyrhizobium sp. HKCCYLS3077]|uniref:hypothetical protein n=1 Tax=Bradyrhizobium sp. HKCCYLS3077 TaxID=3420761 RepID=UPI003EB910F8
MDTRSGQIATICECIDHCFVFTIWCEDFAKFFDEEDIVAGLDRGAELMGEATRLMSFVALRKLDDFLRGAKSKPDDLVAGDFGIDVPGVLAGIAETFLTGNEREKVNKGVAHLTENLALDDSMEGEDVARQLLRMFKDASIDHTRGAHDYRDLLRALFTVQPVAALNEMFAGDAESVKAGVRLAETLTRRRASPLDGVPPEVLIAWCRLDPDTRYPIAAGVGSLFKKDNHATPLQWSPLAPLLLQNAPDPAAMLSFFVKRLYPNSWSGSWATEMESRFRLLAQLDVGDNTELRATRKDVLDRLRSQIEEARVRETAEDKQRNARFE